MATKLEKIKDQIKALRKKAAELEKVHDYKIGKMVREMAAKDWEGFDAEAFKKSVNEILNPNEDKRR
jgi:hypothetical protein